MRPPNARHPRAVHVLLSLAVSASAQAFATTGLLVVESDIVLMEDHSGHVVFSADGVTLDCAGFGVRGMGIGTGILVEARTQVTVANCSVTNFETGIALAASTSSTLISNTAVSNSTWGFLLNGATGNRITGNSAVRNGSASSPGAGVGLLHSDDNVISGNTSRGNFAGIALESSRRTTVAGNLVSGNDNGEGISLRSCEDFILEGNVVTNNSNGGIALYGSSNGLLVDNISNGNLQGFKIYLASNGNRFSGNTAQRNDFYGFEMGNSHGNTLESNRANGNDYIGIGLFSATANVIRDNQACRNTLLDAIQHDGSGNSFIDNRFCTSSGI